MQNSTSLSSSISKQNRRYEIFDDLKVSHELQEKAKRMYLECLSKTGYKLGSVVNPNNCFFEALDHGLVQKNIQISGEYSNDEARDKKLRMLCHAYASKYQHQDNHWLKKTLGDNYSNYLATIQKITPPDIVMSTQNSSSSSWNGRQDVDGRIICEVLKIKLHVLEWEDIANDVVLKHTLIDDQGSAIIKEDVALTLYNKPNVIHIAGGSHCYFVPLLQHKTNKLDASVKDIFPTGTFHNYKVSQLWVRRIERLERSSTEPKMLQLESNNSKKNISKDSIKSAPAPLVLSSAVKTEVTIKALSRLELINYKNLDTKSAKPSSSSLNRKNVKIAIKALLQSRILKSIHQKNISELNVLIGPNFSPMQGNKDITSITEKHREFTLSKYVVILLDRLRKAVQEQIAQGSNDSLSVLLAIYAENMSDVTKNYTSIITSMPLYFNSQLVIVEPGDKNFLYIIEKFREKASDFFKPYLPDSLKCSNLDKYFMDLGKLWLKAQKDNDKKLKAINIIETELNKEKENIKNAYKQEVIRWLVENLNQSDELRASHFQFIDELMNTNANYYKDSQNRTLLDLAFESGHLEVIHLLINRGIFQLTSYTIKNISTDKIIALLGIERINQLLNRVPLITDFKKGLIEVLSAGLKNTHSTAYVLSQFNKVVSKIPCSYYIYFAYKRLASAKIYFSESEYSNFLKTIVKLIMYVIESLNHNNEETIVKYIHTIDKALLPIKVYENLKIHCNNLWEKEAYGIRSNLHLVSDDDKDEELIQLFKKCSALKEKLEDSEDNIKYLKQCIKEMEEKHKKILQEKDNEMQLLKTEKREIVLHYKKKENSDKKRYQEQLKIKEGEIVNLKSKRSTSTTPIDFSPFSSSASREIHSANQSLRSSPPDIELSRNARSTLTHGSNNSSKR